jgi:hypothetical protein
MKGTVDPTTLRAAAGILAAAQNPHSRHFCILARRERSFSPLLLSSNSRANGLELLIKDRLKID